MTDELRNGSGVKVVCAERFQRVNTRLRGIEENQARQSEVDQQMLLELKVLQTKVGFFAAGISVICSVVVGIAIRLVS